MRLEGEDVRPESAALAEEDRVDEAGHAGADLDRSSSRVVEHTCGTLRYDGNQPRGGQERSEATGRAYRTGTPIPRAPKSSG